MKPDDGTALAFEMLVLGEFLKNVSPWTPAGIEAELRSFAAQSGIPFGEVCMSIRIAIIGKTVSEKVTELMALVGRERTVRAVASLGIWRLTVASW